MWSRSYALQFTYLWKKSNTLDWMRWNTIFESLLKFLKDKKKKYVKNGSCSSGVLSLFCFSWVGSTVWNIFCKSLSVSYLEWMSRNAEEYLRRQKGMTEKLNILLLPSLVFIRFLLFCGIICLESARILYSMLKFSLWSLLLTFTIHFLNIQIFLLKSVLLKTFKKKCNYLLLSVTFQVVPWYFLEAEKYV